MKKYVLENAIIETANCFETEDSKYDDTCKDSRACIADGKNKGVFDAIVSRRIVTSKRNQRTKSNVE